MNHVKNSMKQASKRRVELDYIKGFAIIMLIFSHCISEENLIKTWIFLFICLSFLSYADV